MFKTIKNLTVAAAVVLESVARGLRSTVHPEDDWTDTLNDVFYGGSDEDYDDSCPICTYTAAAKGTDCEDCPLC